MRCAVPLQCCAPSAPTISSRCDDNMPRADAVPYLSSIACSAYILQLKDVVNHLFGEPLFARYAGTRTQAMLQSPLYKRLDTAHGGALSALSSESVGSLVAQPTPVGATGAATDPDTIDDEANPDPTDEVMTGDGDELALMFALFVDGVQLHDHGRASTTVVGLKCIDLPGFMCHTDLACFPMAYIGGEKEPTNLSEFTALLLQQFKDHEVFGVVDRSGAVATSKPQ